MNQLNLMQLLEKIANENINLDELVNVIEKDVGLSHKLMKFSEQYRNARMPALQFKRSHAFVWIKAGTVVGEDVVACGIKRWFT
ncbi:hypothetical protein P8629_09590 [Hydrogenovibrio sp. 3SP14C1]|uniref:hypothetical protein n=1 Tax=Hydrogenovibrio sp. 3SP14C1 TaxID=3038774 RepID=UPI0024164C63|nr:hypothetical protein [Hydrogenovibrio sp. 3SP14C1]MDG4813257.1 hypothetical protein [Hydrogenovibrio sp. 3SP14C1]